MSLAATTILRPARPEDFSRLAQIWLEVSERAHAFAPPGYWRKNERDMRDVYLPGSDLVLVAEDDGDLLGFAACRGACLEALFVRIDCQRRGLGKALLDEIKKLHPSGLKLSVYKQNAKARAFYQAQGFAQQAEKTCPGTGLPEILLAWPD